MGRLLTKCATDSPLDLRPLPRPALVRWVGGASSISSWGIWATFWRKIFSKDWAIRTMSSVG